MKYEEMEYKALKDLARERGMFIKANPSRESLINYLNTPDDSPPEPEEPAFDEKAEAAAVVAPSPEEPEDDEPEVYRLLREARENFERVKKSFDEESIELSNLRYKWSRKVESNKKLGGSLKRARKELNRVERYVEAYENRERRTE